MPIDEVLDALRYDPDLRQGFVEWRELPEQPARHAPFPLTCDPRLVSALERRGIEQLYTHQAQSFAAVMQRQNVVVVTPTASGKTLCYNLPVLDAAVRKEGARALYLFPTKALSQDQVAELNAIVERLPVGVRAFL